MVAGGATPIAAINLGKGKITAAVATLGERIASGGFSHEQPLPAEADLARSLNVGRSVLREAIKVLATKGMVVARPRHGTMIQPRSQWNLLDRDVLHWILRPGAVEATLVGDILIARRIIEPEAARLAAAGASAGDRAEITSAVVAMHSAVGDAEASVNADIRFHTAVLKASNNRILLAFSPTLSAILSAFFQVSIQNPDIFPGNLPAHERLAAMIAVGDAAAAHAAMLDVLAYTEADIAARLSLGPQDHLREETS